MIKDQIEAAPHTVRNQKEEGTAKYTQLVPVPGTFTSRWPASRSWPCVRRQMKPATDKWFLAQRIPSRSAGILQLSDKNQAILVKSNASDSLGKLCLSSSWVHSPLTIWPLSTCPEKQGWGCKSNWGCSELASCHSVSLKCLVQILFEINPMGQRKSW